MGGGRDNLLSGLELDLGDKEEERAAGAKERSRPRSLLFCASSFIPTSTRGFSSSGPGASQVAEAAGPHLLVASQSHPSVNSKNERFRKSCLGPAPASARPPGGARVLARLPAGTAGPAANAPGRAPRAAAEAEAAPGARLTAQPSGGGAPPRCVGSFAQDGALPLRSGQEGETLGAGRGRSGRLGAGQGR